ncbi:hypothetical protein AMS68_001882 [Peltaster fructicola]|uniref:LysM domain-containing protein n=1 Tax=Peltaster fructicola TaxID=286661 RepID=A0A6H0XP09_9PEZI|nr:hypothetical protein AMS68_001882 [Peltaster fructicola]
MADSCAICAQSFDETAATAEKAPLPGRHLECCSRLICTRCLNSNKRYETYCPYCQIATRPTSLPQGLRDPPAYSSLADLAIPPPPEAVSDELPPYASKNGWRVDEKHDVEDAPDVLHFVAPNDTINSLSLGYDVPANVLRKQNNIYADHLLHGRKTILIPGSHYKGGVSLSPQPLESEEEEIKKNKIRRWMVSCKVSEYDVALLYLKQAEWCLEDAIEAYREDEVWEKDHPRNDKSKGRLD